MSTPPSLPPEKRRGLRFRLHVPIRYGGDASGQGMIWNISRSGVRVERAPAPLPPLGADLSLEFELPPDGSSFTVAGPVVRHTVEGFAVHFDPDRSNAGFYPRLEEIADPESAPRA